MFWSRQALIKEKITNKLIRFWVWYCYSSGHGVSLKIFLSTANIETEVEQSVLGEFIF